MKRGLTTNTMAIAAAVAVGAVVAQAFAVLS